MAQIVAKILHHKFLVLICLLIFIIYSPKLNHQFIWDDYDFILKWELTHHPLENLTQLLAGALPYTHQGPYRPVRSLLYAFSFGLYQTNPYFYHLQTLGVHLLATILVFFVTLEIFHHQTIAQLTALLFSLHPINTEAIAWITANFDTFGFVFLLASILTFLRHQTHPSSKFKLASFAFAILATFTYELTLILPLILLLITRYLKPSQSSAATLKLISPYFFISASYFLFRSSLNLPSSHIPFHFSTQDHLLLAVLLLGRYLQLFLLPANLNINHQFAPQVSNFFDLDFNHLAPAPVLSPISQQFILSSLLLVAFILAAFISRSKYPIITFAIAWIFISLIPVLQFIPQKGIFAERYAYFASIGFALLVSFIIFQLSSFLKPLSRRLLSQPLLLSSPLLLIYLFLIAHRLPTFASNQTLWSTAAKTNPNSAGIKNALAIYYINQGDYAQALPILQTAWDQNPSIPSLNRNLIITYHQLNLPHQLIPLAENYLSQIPIDYPIELILAQSYQQIGKPQKAAAIYQQLLSRNPNDPIANQALIELAP